MLIIIQTYVNLLLKYMQRIYGNNRKFFNNPAYHIIYINHLINNELLKHIWMSSKIVQQNNMDWHNMYNLFPYFFSLIPELFVNMKGDVIVLLKMLESWNIVQKCYSPLDIHRKLFVHRHVNREIIVYLKEIYHNELYI